MKIKWFSIIRVIGLLLVLTYHFFKKNFPGGFIGVDLFFTFSGYLVTSVFLDEFAKSERIDLVGFAKRRLYRILPPVVLMVLVTIPFTLLIRRDVLAGIGKQIASALGFVSNFYEILTGGNYEAQFIPHLFVHTWSLAIEVQFYVLWALIVWWGSKTMKRLNRLRGTLFLTAFTLFVLTYFSMVVGSFMVNSYSTIYFSSLTHIFPFFVGACLATLIGLKETTKLYEQIRKKATSKQMTAILVGACLSFLLLGRLLNFNHIISYLLGFLLSSLATSLLIIVFRVLHDRTEQFAEPVWLSMLAEMSYGIYLFHWPFYIIFSQLLPNALAALVTILLSLICSGLSFYFIEPWIAGRQPKFLGVTFELSPYKRLVMSVVGVLTVLVFGIVLTAPARGDFETQMLVDSLNQSANQLQQTRTLTGQAKASKYEILDGVTIIGDSVTLRASSALSEAIPGAIIDAQSSRNTTQANDILANNVTNGTLTKYVVIGTGVNVVYNYKEELERLISSLPKGYALILITPYDGNSATYDDPVAQKHRAYELELAQKYDFITIADWGKVATEHPEIWVGTDNIHFGADGETIAQGASLYAEVVQQALEVAKTKPIKE